MTHPNAGSSFRAMKLHQARWGWAVLAICLAYTVFALCAAVTMRSWIALLGAVLGLGRAADTIHTMRRLYREAQ